MSRAQEPRVLVLGGCRMAKATGSPSSSASAQHWTQRLVMVR
jgi:hypothetical protein